MREGVYFLAGHLAVDAISHDDLQPRIAQTAYRFLHFLSYRINLHLEVLSIIRTKLIEPDQKTFKDIDIIGTTKSVIGTKHDHSGTFHVTGLYKRRIERCIRGQDMAHN